MSLLLLLRVVVALSVIMGVLLLVSTMKPLLNGQPSVAALKRVGVACLLIALGLVISYIRKIVEDWTLWAPEEKFEYLAVYALPLWFFVWFGVAALKRSHKQ